MLGIFDSGVGGLTVVKELLRRHPDADFLYLGDTARTPYGNKSPETIARYAVEDAQFLVSHGADVLVVACNSMSAYAMDALHTAFPSLSIYEVITPAVAAAVATTKGRVGVIGTRATISSGLYEERIKEARSDVDVRSVACPLFVPLVEEGMTDARETKMIVRRYLAPLRAVQVDTLILGCTHYPLLKEVIQEKIGKRVTIIDSPSAVCEVMEKEGAIASGSGKHTFYFTDDNPRTREIAEKWLGSAVKIENAELG